MRGHLDGRQIFASFLVQEFDCDPSEITRIIRSTHEDVAPRRAEAKTSVRYPANGWQLSSALPNTSDAADQAGDILRCVYPDAKNLREMGTFDVRLMVAVYISDFNRPPLIFDRDLVAKFGELGAAIDIDLYIL